MAPVQGFWGQPTSTLDWCESNYDVNSYIAEFWNTLSNLSMIVPPLYGIYESCRNQFEVRFTVCFALLIVVGCGSWAFHMTLLYEMQLTDELPMIFCSCFLLYCLADIQHMQTQSHLNWLSVSLVIYSLIFTLSYLLYPNPLLHQAIYGLTTIIITALDVRLVRTQTDRQLWRLFYGGMVCYSTAFLLWNVDNHMCLPISRLRASLPPLLSSPAIAVRYSDLPGGDQCCPVLFHSRLRASLPPLLRPLTQLHAWWHLLAGYASYMHILFCMKIWYNLRQQKAHLTLGKLGLTIRRPEVATNGCKNGHHKTR
ncbi:Alkaline ceramidase 3 [Amphibalanus amphitrite]|uniref:Alkaline ceramidase n=1 Tax=Amphibalanus amphitrite TaxID=1232801 RepID=A0A6A4VEL5_AMPAM|nr:Alkaline ceramidase 3 [Amphibalanus amphitrite]